MMPKIKTDIDRLLNRGEGIIQFFIYTYYNTKCSYSSVHNQPVNTLGELY